MSAENSTTVDWSRWMALDGEAQARLWDQYKGIVKAEAMALHNDPSKLNAALRERR